MPFGTKLGPIYILFKMENKNVSMDVNESTRWHFNFTFSFLLSNANGCFEQKKNTVILCASFHLFNGLANGNFDPDPIRISSAFIRYQRNSITDNDSYLLSRRSNSVAIRFTISMWKLMELLFCCLCCNTFHGWFG